MRLRWLPPWWPFCFRCLAFRGKRKSPWNTWSCLLVPAASLGQSGRTRMKVKQTPQPLVEWFIFWTSRKRLWNGLSFERHPKGCFFLKVIQKVVKWFIFWTSSKRLWNGLSFNLIPAGRQARNSPRPILWREITGYESIDEWRIF